MTDFERLRDMVRECTPNDVLVISFDAPGDPVRVRVADPSVFAEHVDLSEVEWLRPRSHS